MPALPNPPLVNLTPTATVLGIDDARVVAFDREGRLLTYARGESFWKRGLDSRLRRRERTAQGRWQLLVDDLAVEVFAEAYALAAALRGSNASPELTDRLEAEILRWTPAGLLAEASRFAAVYRPIAILPPDQYLSVVVQATEGCTWNRCTFCSFYLGRPFRARPLGELEAHLVAVRELLGRDLARRRSVFLADGNALALGRRQLLPIVESVAAAFPGLPIASFVDVWSGERHDPLDWSELARRGLDQVAIGMETGLDELLGVVNKPGSRAELTTFVAALREAGLRLSLIVVVGLGGAKYRQVHREATLEALAELGLGRRDLIYLSPFVEDPRSLYAARRDELGLGSLSAAGIDAECELWAAALRAQGLRVGRYDLREFFY